MLRIHWKLPIAAAWAVFVLGLCGATSAQAAPPSKLAALPKAPPASALTPPPSRPCPPQSPDCLDISASMTYRGFVDWTRDDVNGFWADLFEQAGIGWIPAKQLDIPYGYYATTRCERGTRITSGDGPFYCSADGPGTVFLPLLGIKRLIFPRSTFRARDFAITYVVAHEWGHHVQDLLGLITPGARSIDLELQADCLAGVWAYSVWYRGLLRPGDITEALRLAALIGDARGTSPNAAGAHGTSAQRVGAFLRGYRSGLPSRCAN